jgi:hypothetical protein
MMIKHSGLLGLLLMAACASDSTSDPFHEAAGAAGVAAESPPKLDAAVPERPVGDAGLAEPLSRDAGGSVLADACGNGILDPGEECDDTAAKHRCPTTQNDCEVSRDLCWRWRVEGEGCHRRCVHAHGVCEDVLDPREPHGLLLSCRNECPADTDVNNPWK